MDFEVRKAERKMISLHSVFSPDDTKLFTIMGSKVVVRDSVTLERIFEIPIKNADFIHFSLDGEKVFINTTSGSVYIYETDLFKCEKVLRSTQSHRMIDSDFYIDDTGVNLFIELDSEIALMMYDLEDDVWKTAENFAGSSVSFQALNNHTVLFIVSEGDTSSYIVENELDSMEFIRHPLSSDVVHKSFFKLNGDFYSYNQSIAKLQLKNGELTVDEQVDLDALQLGADEQIIDVLVADTIDYIVLTTTHRTLVLTKDFVLRKEINVANCAAATMNHKEDMIVINSVKDSMVIKIA